MIRERTAAVALLSLMPIWTASAQTNGHVKVTPLGGQEGEFCSLDRAFVFEDPDGTRISTMPGGPSPAPATRGSARSTPC